MTVGELKKLINEIPDNITIVDWRTGIEITDVWRCETEEYTERQFKNEFGEIISGEILCF